MIKLSTKVGGGGSSLPKLDAVNHTYPSISTTYGRRLSATISVNNIKTQVFSASGKFMLVDMYLYNHTTTTGRFNADLIIDGKIITSYYGSSGVVLGTSDYAILYGPNTEIKTGLSVADEPAVLVENSIVLDASGNPNISTTYNYTLYYTLRPLL